MSQAEDMDAINKFFLNAQAKTPEATKDKQAWSAWFSSLGMYDKYWNSDIYNEARSRRNKFNLDNAQNQKETDLVVRVMTTGMTTEEMQGKPKPAIDPKTGVVGATAIRRLETALVKSTSMPTIRQGNKAAKGTPLGDAIIKWQTFLGIKGDGNFGPGTHTATVAWQKAHALTTDGVVGPKTWTSAFQAPPAAKDSQPGLLAAILTPNALPSPASKPAATPEVKQRMTTAIGAAAKNAAAQAKKTTAKATGKPQSSARPQGSAKPQTSAKPQASAAPSSAIVPVQQASMFSWFKNMPVWGYIAGGLAAVVLVKTGTIRAYTPEPKSSKRR